jgi:hypothetical protein
MYKLLKNPITNEINSVQRLSDNMFIPFDQENPEYKKYLKWLDGYELVGFDWVKTSEGNTPIPVPEPTYAEKRAAEYPSFADQFDLLYHGGEAAWKAAIQAVKDKYPKE